MQQTALIRLRNKLSPEIFTDPIQIDASMNEESLSMYLNGVLNSSSGYLFYYNDERIVGDIAEVLEKHRLGTEDAVTIDYLDKHGQREDESIPCEDVVTDICTYAGKVAIRLYNGTSYILHGEVFKDKTESIVAGDFIYAVAESGVINLETGAVIKTRFDDEHPLIAVERDNVAVCIKKKIYYVTASETKEFYAEDAVRELQIANGYFYWIESLDTVVKYNMEKKKRQAFYTKQTVTYLAIDGDTIYCGTSDSKLLRITDGKVEKLPVNSRAIQKILVYNKTLILVSQRIITSFELPGLAEKTCVFLDEQINAVEIASEKMYVGNGMKISVFNISRFI